LLCTHRQVQRSPSPRPATVRLSQSALPEEETLRQLNEKLPKAHDKADVTTLDQIESDDFTLAGDFGTVTKREHLDQVRLAGGQPEPVNRLIIPQQIRFYGDVALITETDHASRSGGAKSDYQTTSMWVRSGESWRICAYALFEIGGEVANLAIRILKMLLPKNAHRERGISRKQETTDSWKVITREMEFRFFLRRAETDMKCKKTEFIASTAVWVLGLAISTQGQMIDNTQAPNTAKAGINKSLLDEIGSGRGDGNTAGSSLYIINRDPFRSIRRGRQLFQRKFTRLEGQGANEKDGVGDINTDIAIGVGLSDSCASCHSRPSSL
jgi:Domain of unknown function (DUF4440)